MLRGMWDLPRPGLEPVSPALAGRFLTTVPPGKPLKRILKVLAKLLDSLNLRLCHSSGFRINGGLKLPPQSRDEV